MNCATVLSSLPKYAVPHLRHKLIVIMGPHLGLCISSTTSLFVNNFSSHRLPSQTCSTFRFALSVLAGTLVAVQFKRRVLHQSCPGNFLGFKNCRPPAGITSFFSSACLCSASRATSSFHVVSLASYLRGVVHPSFFFWAVPTSSLACRALGKSLFSTESPIVVCLSAVLFVLLCLTVIFT